MQDSFVLTSKSLSDDTEHTVIGLLVGKDHRFAKNVLDTKTHHVLINPELETLLSHIRALFFKMKRKPFSDTDVRRYLADVYVDDKQRAKHYLELLNRCIQSADGANGEEVYDRMQDVLMSKSLMAKAHATAVAFADGSIDKAGPEMRAKVRNLGEDLIDAARPYNAGPPTPDETLALLEKQEAQWEASVKNRLPFIDDRIKDFMLTPGITLIGGQTKAGKSTVLANMVGAIIHAKPDKKILIITCEENLDAVLTRIACCFTESSIREIRTAAPNVAQDEVAKVKATKRWLTQKIIVVSEGTTVVENVQQQLLDAKENDELSAIMVDYYQVIGTSNEKRKSNYVEVLKDFGTWLKEYAQDLTIPLAVFAQLWPTPDKGMDAPFPQLVQFDHTIANHAHVSLEIVRVRDEAGQNLTQIQCKLSRHGDQLGIVGQFVYKSGRLEYIPYRPVEEIAMDGIKPKK